MIASSTFPQFNNSTFSGDHPLANFFGFSEEEETKSRMERFLSFIESIPDHMADRIHLAMESFDVMVGNETG